MQIAVKGRNIPVTEALDHAELDPSLGDIPAFVSLDGFVVRSLREARRTEPDS